MGNEFGHPEWIDFPRDDTYDTSTGEFVPGEPCMDNCIPCASLPGALLRYLQPAHTLKDRCSCVHLSGCENVPPLPPMQAMAAAWRSAGGAGTWRMPKP